MNTLIREVLFIIVAVGLFLLALDAAGACWCTTYNGVTICSGCK